MVVSNVSAEYIDFTQYDFGSSETLNIEGVKIQGGTWANDASPGLQICTRNLGLGCASLGNTTTVDRCYIFKNGVNTRTESWFQESIRLSVDGSINSVTILPYFTVVGSSEPLFIPFYVSILADRTGVEWDGADNANPKVLLHPPFATRSWVEVGLAQNWDPYGLFSYSLQHPDEEVTFQFGFSVLGLDYAPVPEPSSFALVSLASLLLAGFRRRPPRDQVRKG